MDKNREIAMFAGIAREFPSLIDWLKEELESQYEVLTLRSDEPALRQAQGKAQMLKTLIRRLEESPGLVRR